MYKELMLIDDDEDDREIFLSVIEHILPSVRCITATNGYEALQQLNQNDVIPDLIFLDLNMPLMNGRQFLEEVSKHEQLKQIPIIILSTSSDRASMKDAIGLGAKDFVTKPDKFSAWEETLKRVITISA